MVFLVIVAINFVDMNSFREPITRALSEASGLDVSIGDLGLDWSGGLGLRADEVSVFSRQGNRTLFSSEALFLKVRWGPLLDKKIDVTEAVIQRPVFLIHPQPESPPPVEAVPSQKPAPLTTAQVRLAPMKRLLMGLHLNAETVRVEDAMVLWFGEDETKKDPLEINASMVLKVHRPDDKRLDLEVRQLKVSSNSIELSGSARGENVLSASGTLQASLSGKPFDLQTLSAFLPNLPGDVKKLWDRFDPVGQMTAWKVEARAKDVNLFDDSIMEGKGVASDLQFEVHNLVFQPPPDQPELRLGFGALKGQLHWSDGKLIHDLNGDMQNIPLGVKGSLTLPGADSKSPSRLQTVVRIVKAPAQSLNPWMPPDWTIEKGEMSHRINVRGALDNPQSMRIDGVLEGADLQLGFLRDPNLKLPLKSLKGEWKLDVKRITVPVLDLTPPHGAIKSQATYQMADRSYAVEYKAQNLRVEDFYQQNVDGDLASQGTLRGILPLKGSPLARVSGKVGVKATAGRFYQLEPLRAILTVLNPLSVTQLNEKGLRYDSLGGDFTVDKGTLATQNLTLLSPEMKIFLAGTADPVHDRVNMKGRFQPSQNLDRVVKSVPILGEILTGGKKGGVLESRFTLTGPLRRPKVTLDAGGTLTGKGNDILRELGKLPGKFSR